MYLTISKRFEISLSYRHYNRDWSDARNREFYGAASGGEHGFGGNFAACFVFSGAADRVSGMVINVTDIKEKIGALLAARYDHKYLNADTPPFDRVVPTPETVARQLLEDARPLFADDAAQLVACHLETSGTDAATWSPHLSEEENKRLFGLAASPSGHGHYYYLRAVLGGEIDPESGLIASPDDVRRSLRSLYQLLDHRNLNIDVPELSGMPMTTESLVGFIHERLCNRLPVVRTRLWENPKFFAECGGSDQFSMGIRTSFRAAHRLHSPHLGDNDNRKLYGKCNNPSGHGHLYRVETTVDGPVDAASGTLFPLEDLISGVEKALAPWDYRHLDLDTEDFRDQPSTGENIVAVLWPRIEDALNCPLVRLRLWETPNNRFTLRRETPA